MKTKLLLALFFLLIFCAFSSAQTSIYDFSMKDIDGKEVKLSKFKGKVLLIVNTASNCGFTPQYKDLEAFYLANKDKGFEILGFPANDFMGQEPGTDADIKQFCARKYEVTFQMFSKITVKGKKIDALYKYLTQRAMNGKVEAPVKWNFQKFLIDRNGKVIAFFPPNKSVSEAEVSNEIQTELAK